LKGAIVKLDYYDAIAQLHAAARRERAQAIGRYIGLAFAWLVSRKPHAAHAARPHFAR
jgi:hypothetical protein